ncbi:MAG: endo-1,3-alpha-glucanase family glycosylhydrolase, partial [Bradymonadaceae bacterium]
SYVEAEEQYAMALDAAEATGVPIVWGTLGYNEEIVPMIIEKKDRPGLFRDAEGRLVLSGYHNAWGLKQEGHIFPVDPDPAFNPLQDLRDAGIDFAYWPDMPYHPEVSNCKRAAELGATGAFDFKYDSNIGLGGGVSTYREWLIKADEHLADCNEHGIGTMPPMLPYYAAQTSHNWMMFESFAYVGFREQWRWAIENEVPAVQIVTINDFNEHTYLQTFGDGGPLVGTPETTWWAGALVTDHSGFGKFMKRYSDWYRTGFEPRITQDQYLIAYRLHPRTALSWDDLSQEEQAALQHWLPTNPQYHDYPSSQMKRLDSHRVMEDSVQVVVRITETSTVTLEAGSSTLTEELEPGEHIMVIPGALIEETPGGPKPTFTPEQFGYPKLTVTRNGQTVFEATAPLEITEYIVPGKFNYYAAELSP